MTENTNETEPITLSAKAAEWVANVLLGIANAAETDGPNRLAPAQLAAVWRHPGEADDGFRANFIVEARGIAQDLVDQLLAGHG